MNIDQSLGQIRPILSLIGSAVVALGLLKFFGVNIPLAGSGLELAVAGYLIKAI